LALDHVEGPRRLRGKRHTGADMRLQWLRWQLLPLQQRSGGVKVEAHGMREAGQVGCQLERSQRLVEVQAGGVEGRLAQALRTGAAAAGGCAHRWITRAAAVFSTGWFLLRILVGKARLQKLQGSSLSICTIPM
jgi:hypothetical protein